MGINRQNFITGFTAAAITLCSVATPIIANAEDVIIRHGDTADTQKLERYLQRAAKRGVEIELEGGLGITSCFALFNEEGNELLRVSPEKVRELVAAASSLERGGRINIATTDSCPATDIEIVK